MATIIMLPVFYVAVFHVQKFFVQIEMQEELKHKQLIILQIPADKIQWHKEGKEILVDGFLFDVKSITYKNGLATIKGLYDKQENEINEQIKKASGESENNTINTTLVKLLECFFITHEQVATVGLAAGNNNAPQLRSTDTDRLPNNYISVPTPPPLG